MNHKQKIGRWGEGVAAAFLQNLGYELIEKNARTPYGEIDLVFRFREVTVFVEVKARTSAGLALPEASITPRKQQHMLDSAGHYAQEHRLDSWQIDVVTVVGKPEGGKPEITHFEDIL